MKLTQRLTGLWAALLLATETLAQTAPAKAAPRAMPLKGFSLCLGAWEKRVVGGRRGLLP